jgi:hypothetical protein
MANSRTVRSISDRRPKQIVGCTAPPLSLAVPDDPWSVPRRPNASSRTRDAHSFGRRQTYTTESFALLQGSAPAITQIN